MVDAALRVTDPHVLFSVDVIPVGVCADAAPGLAVVSVQCDAGVVQTALVPEAYK